MNIKIVQINKKIVQINKKNSSNKLIKICQMKKNSSNEKITKKLLK